MKKKIIVGMVLIGAIFFILGFLWTTLSPQLTVSKLSKTDPEVVAKAIKDLTNMGDRAVPAISELLQDNEANTSAKRFALGILVSIGTDKSLELCLRNCASEDDYEICRQNLTEQSKAILLDCAINKKENSAVALSILMGLKANNMDTYASLLDKGDDTIRLKVLAAIKSFPDESTFPLYVKALSATDYSTRRLAAERIGKIGNPQSVEKLAALLNDPSPEVFSTVIQALSSQNLQPAGKNALKDFFKKNYAPHCGQIAKKLATLGEKEIIQNIIAYFPQADYYDKNDFIEALCEFKSPEAAGILLNAIGDKQHNIRSTASKGFQQLDVQAGPEVVKFLDSNPNASQLAIITALNWLGKNKINSAYGSALRLLKDSQKTLQLRDAALQYLITTTTDENLAEVNEAVRGIPEFASKATQYFAGSDATPVPELINMLSSDNLTGKRAFKTLVNKGVAILPELKAVLEKEETPKDLKVIIIELIAELKTPEAMAIFTATFSSKDYHLIDAAMVGLRNLGEPAMPEILNALKNTDESVRLAAASAIRQIGGSKVVEPLIDALADKNDSVADTCRLTLEECKDPILPLLLAKMNIESPDARLRLGKVIGMKSEQDSAPLIAKLSDPDTAVRYTALVALNYLNEEKALPAIVDLLNDKDQKLLYRAVEAVIRFNEKSLPYLVSFLQKEHPEDVRRLAMKILIELPTKERYAQIVKFLKDKDKDVKLKALRGLAVEGLNGYLNEIKECFKDTESTVAMRAVTTLSTISTKESLDAILEAFTHPDKNVRAMAVHELGTSSNYFDKVAGMLNDQDPYVRAIVLQTLRKTGKPEALPIIKKAITDLDAQVRYTATIGLGNLGGSAEVPDLIKLITDPDANTANAAIDGLIKISSPTAVAPLMKAMEDYKSTNLLLAGACIIGVQKLAKQDFGLNKGNASEEEINTAIKKASEWWEKNKGEFTK